jgi:hypothetical protein
MKRSKVHKGRSARNFRRKQGRTKRVNLVRPMRGGFRI